MFILRIFYRVVECGRRSRLGYDTGRTTYCGRWAILQKTQFEILSDARSCVDCDHAASRQRQCNYSLLSRRQDLGSAGASSDTPHRCRHVLTEKA